MGPSEGHGGPSDAIDTCKTGNTGNTIKIIFAAISKKSVQRYNRYFLITRKFYKVLCYNNFLYKNGPCLGIVLFCVTICLLCVKKYHPKFTILNIEFTV